MTYLGNEASWHRVGRAKLKVKKRRLLSSAIRPVVERLEERRLLSIDITSFSNAVADTGTPMNMHLEFNRGDSLPADSYNVDVYWNWDDSVQGDGAHDSYSVEAPDNQGGQIDLPHTFTDVGNYPVHVHVTGPTDAGDGDPTYDAWGTAWVLAEEPPPPTIESTQIRLGAHQTRMIAGGSFNLHVDYSNPIYNGGLDVDWGDGSDTEHFSTPAADVSHVYATTGQYTISAASNGGTATGLDLDSSFGTAGQISESTTMAFHAMAADGAGKFVAVARDEIDGRGFVVRQYGASGAVNWTTRVSFASWMGTTGYPIATASAVSVQHDGKILVAGDIWTGTAYRFAMARLNPTGAVDTSFGTAGLVVTSFTGADARANAIAVNPLTGAITLAGFAGGNVALARYTNTGAPDTTFGTAGKLTIDLGSAADIAYGLTIDAAGGLIVTGRKNNDMAVVRLLAGGSADTLFGDNHDGKEIIDLGGQEYAYSAATDSQNRIIIAGETTPDWSSAQLALVRLTATGHLDTGFASGGKWITSFYNLPGYLRAVAIDSQDRILFAGGVLDSDHGRVVLGRVNTNGTLDNSFAESGIIVHDLFDESPTAPWATTLMNDNRRIIVAEATGSHLVLWGQLPKNTLTVVKPLILSIAAGSGNPASPKEGDNYTLALSAVQGQDDDMIDHWVIHTGEQDVIVAGDPQSATFTWLNNGTHTITAEAVGSAGDVYPASQSISVSVANVLPTVTALSAQSLRAGDLATISTSFQDAGTIDVHTASVNWGDGTTTEADILESDGAGNIYATHTYAAAGAYTATLTVYDGTGTVQKTAAMTVTNSASSLSPFSVAPINEGDTAGFTAYFADSDPSDIHTAMVNWGDGTSEPAFVSESDGDGSVADSHIYADNGSYTITLTLTDGSGAAVTRSATVAVANVAPRVDVGGFVQRFEAGADLPFSADVFDPGIIDTFTYQWSILDVDGQSVATGMGETLTMAQPTVATYTVALTVTDDDGGVGSATSTIVVYPIGSPPTITAPTAPSGLSIGTASPDGVTISWTDNSNDEDGFAVEWSDDGSDFYVIGTVGPGATSYEDGNPLLNQSNYYKVIAYADLTESSPSNVDSKIVYTADVGVYDDNGGYNGRNTLSLFSVTHDHVLDNASVFGNDVEFVPQLDYFATVDSAPSDGSLNLADDGSFTYTPDAGFVGTDTFTYVIWNGHYTSAPAEVSIDVTNALPEVSNVTMELSNVVQDDTTYPNAAEGYLSAADGDEDGVTYKKLGDPEHGTLLDFDPSTGHYLYVADSDYTGYDSFNYAANDGIDDGEAATVSLEDHNPPVQGNFYVTLEKNGLVLLNNHDIPGDQFIPDTPPEHGTITANTGGTGMGFYYTPDAGFTGTDIATLIRRRGNLDSKPFTVKFIVRDPTDPYPDDKDWAGGGRIILPIPADEQVTRDNTLTWFLSDFNPAARVEIDTDAQHGTVDLTPLGTLTYTPNSGESYRGWDSFSFKYTNAPLNSAPNWVVLDVGGSDPYVAPPPLVFTPEKFPNSLKGLWDAFIQAKNAIGPVLSKMERVGEITKQITDQGTDPSEGQQADLVTALEGAVTAFGNYTKCYQAAVKAMGKYKADQYIVTGWDSDVFAAINSLPLDIAGLKPDEKQLGKWRSAMAEDARGTDFMVANANMVVQMAKDTHKAMQTALYAGGVASLAISGTQLLTQKGCTEFVKWATKAMVSTAIGMGVGNGISGAIALAKKWGFSVNEDYVNITSDGLQLLFLVKAARKQRKASASNCFVAGTEVMTGTTALPGVFGETRIEDVKVSDLVWSRDQYDPNAPLELKRVVQTFKHKTYDLQTVSVTDEAGNTEILHVSDQHPFYVEGQGFTDAVDVTVGEHLSSPDGHSLSVVGNVDEKPADGAWVYNFEVENDHTYFVEGVGGSDAFIWVHNACNPYLDGKTPLAGTRGTGVRRAKDLEVQLVTEKGYGTSPWTPKEIAFIKANQKLPPYAVGHHINNVHDFPEWAGDPRNVLFVNGQGGNLAAHGGNFQTGTTGELIDRAAMLNGD